MESEFCMYTVMDADKGERFITTDFESLNAATRERNRLALNYGKEFCLVVAGIDQSGNLHEIENAE